MLKWSSCSICTLFYRCSTVVYVTLIQILNKFTKFMQYCSKQTTCSILGKMLVFDIESRKENISVNAEMQVAGHLNRVHQISIFMLIFCCYVTLILQWLNNILF